MDKSVDAESIELRDEIKETVSKFREIYDNTFGCIKDLKTKMNVLEQKTSQGKGSARTQYILELNSASKNLNELSDSLLLISKEAWHKYRELGTRCKNLCFESTLLDDVRVFCVKIEGMAADLLCYSLGH